MANINRKVRNWTAVHAHFRGGAGPHKQPRHVRQELRNPTLRELKDVASCDEEIEVSSSHEVNDDVVIVEDFWEETLSFLFDRETEE